MNLSKKGIAIALSIIMSLSATAVSAGAVTVDTNSTQAAAPNTTGAFTNVEPVQDETQATENTQPQQETQPATEATQATEKTEKEISGAVTASNPTGDVNGDNKLNLIDIAILQQHISEKKLLTDLQISKANLDKNKINFATILTLQKTIIDVSDKPEYIAVSGVSLNKTSVTLNIGETSALASTVSPADATDKSVTYTSSNTAVAAVSASGVITAKGSGTATITVATAGSSKASCTVKVNPVASTLTFSGFTKMTNDTISAGVFHTLAGKVTSNYPITSVKCAIEGTSMSKTVTMSASKNVKSYSVYDAFDDLMAFSDAGVGTHYFKVYATDTQKTSLTLLYSYKYTVVSSAPSSSLKALTSAGTTYYVPNGYSSSYLYDQCDYSKFNWGGTNVGCSATAEAIGASIYYGKKITPDSSSIIWTSAGAGWGLASVRYYNCSVTTKLKQAYDELMKGKPSIINTVSSSDHWLTIVGVKKGANRNNLSTSDFLIANPWGGSLNNLTTYLNSTGRSIPYDYSLRCYK